MSDPTTRIVHAPETIGQHIYPWPETVYSDAMIKDACSGDFPMISPFVDHLVNKDPVTGEKLVSYGLSSYGYDLRIGEEYIVLKRPFPIIKFLTFLSLLLAAVANYYAQYYYLSLAFIFGAVVWLQYGDRNVIDPKNFPTHLFKRKKAKNGKIVVPPHSTILGYSMERFEIPDDTTGICVGKSTYARTGLSCLNTPVEAGWEGYLTLEFSNGTNMPIIMYAGEGALQLVLFKGPKAEVNYRDRAGKYMNQPAQVVTPTV